MTDSAPSPAWPLALRLSALWLVHVAWSACAGWILSWLGQLHGTGYLVATLPLVVALAAVWRASSGSGSASLRPRSLARRPAVAAWLLVTLLCLAGGILYAPSNYDGLSYRLPRILYWWQENRWHWLEHADSRMNNSGAGIEWQSLPWMMLTGNDRLLFLLNWLPFLLFPALTFHALQSFRVENSAAARWMWILPLGYGFALQASSIGNDAVGGILVVASLAFAGLAEKRGSFAALILSAIAASALTGLKSSNLPLLLPLGWFWAKAAWQIRGTIRGWLLAPACIAAILSSFLPLAVLNHLHCGNWAGDPDDSMKLRITKTVPGLLGNGYNALIGTVQAPVLPLPVETKRWILAPLQGDSSITSYIKTGFPRFKPHLGGEIPIEEGAGLGLGIALLLAAHAFQRRRPSSATAPWIAIAATLIAAAAYMAKMGSENTARLMLPYAPLLIASYLALIPRRQPAGVPAKFAFAWLPLLCLMPGLILSPSRPLIPLTAIAAVPALPASLRDRILELHQGYSSRNDPLRPIRVDLPADAAVVGFAGGPTRSAYSLFRPFGSRRVIEAHPGNIDSFEWLVAMPEGIRERLGMSWDDWLASSPYTVVSRHRITFVTSFGPEDWYLLRKRPIAQDP